MKTHLIVPLIVGVIAVAIVLIYPGASENRPPAPATAGYKSTSFTIDNQPITLIGGTASVPSAPGSASKTTTTYFGNDVTGDLNGDGLPDAAFIVTQDTGGSGTFYYVVAALKTATGYQGTNAVLLGDRIAPQSTEIQNGKIVVNYADRAAGEPMTAQPTVGVTKYLTVQDATLVSAGPTAGLGEHCGGNMTTAASCATGLHCAPNPGSHLPFGDVGGVCVAD